MLKVVDHPLIQSELTCLRDRSCPPHAFRTHVRRIASLMVPAVTENLETEPVPCETPLEVTSGARLVRPIVLAPILRAGIGFFDGFLDLLPEASTAHIGLARNEETLRPEPYYFKTPPELPEADVLVLDPMLATGGSAAEAITRLREAGARNLIFACLVAAPEGVATLEQAHPDVPIFTAALDRCLNGKGYILPGLGDAGDRIFGT
ncbi:uracil phosphoribosyltransferase [Haloferula sp. A504]|uniref:uracil phosphoribosyltransferase n=1 Tax=Haloferula sp. A504 TaxID=3373601 RepID=UPI0031C222B6|nr:uracil phosphoribosyltransferase [Verrucomicrobiaceae bacterium E54]